MLTKRTTRRPFRYKPFLGYEFMAPQRKAEMSLASTSVGVPLRKAMSDGKLCKIQHKNGFSPLSDSVQNNIQRGLNMKASLGIKCNSSLIPHT